MGAAGGGGEGEGRGGREGGGWFGIGNRERRKTAGVGWFGPLGVSFGLRGVFFQFNLNFGNGNFGAKYFRRKFGGTEIFGGKHS